MNKEQFWEALVIGKVIEHCGNCIHRSTDSRYYCDRDFFSKTVFNSGKKCGCHGIPRHDIERMDKDERESLKNHFWEWDEKNG